MARASGEWKILPAPVFHRGAKTEGNRCFLSEIFVLPFSCNFSLAWNPLPGRQLSAVIMKTSSVDLRIWVYIVYHFLA